MVFDDQCIFTMSLQLMSNDIDGHHHQGPHCSASLQLQHSPLRLLHIVQHLIDALERGGKRRVVLQSTDKQKSERNNWEGWN